MILKYLDLCIYHLTRETVDNLLMENIPYVKFYTYEEEMHIIVPDTEDKLDDVELPEDLENLLQYASSRGYSLIILGIYAEKLDDLRMYEW